MISLSWIHSLWMIKVPTVQFSTAELCLMAQILYSISSYNLQSSAEKALD